MSNPNSSSPSALHPGTWSTQQKVQTGFGFAVGCLVIVAVVSFLAVHRLRSDAAMVEHTRAVIDDLESIFSATTDAQNGYRGYAVTGDESYLEPFVGAQASVLARVDGLIARVADNPRQQERARELRKLAESKLQYGEQVVQAWRTGGFEAARTLMMTRLGKRYHDEVRSLVETMKREEGMLLADRAGRAERSAVFTQTVIIGGSIIAFAVVGLASLAIRRDFAGRVRAEQALRQSEESLAITLNSIGDAVLATDTQGRITRMNPVAEKLTGWSAAEAMNRPIAEVFRIFNETTRERGLIPVDRVLETGEIQELANHTVLVSRSGKEYAIADSAAPIRDRDAKVIGVVLVFRDVSAERAAEIQLASALADLARERARLKFIFDSLPIGISFVVTDADGRSTRMINDSHLRICGLTREEANDQQSFVRITHPQDRERQAVLIRQLEAGIIDHGAIDKRYVLPDGRIRWVMLSFQRQKRPDGSCEDLSTVVDISERKEAVAQLERFFELSLDFLCISSADGYFKRVSPTVKDLLGWEVEEFLAKPFLDMVHPDDRAATLREVERQVVNGESVLQFENRYRHKNGSWRVLSWRSVPQPDGLMYATARDVTERNHAADEIMRLNQELQHHSEQLEAANRELEAFSYSVSHDLRAPLRHIQGYVGMLTRELGGNLSEKGQRFLSTISAAGRDMSRLIDDLLQFSRMGRAEMHETAVDPLLILESVRKDLEVAISGRNIRWNFNALPKAQGDPAMFKQVFANLLDNAVKYSRGRDPAIIEVGCAGEEDGRMIIFVRDNGAGFDMKYASKLFGVFQRLHRADEFEGTGIGLANVQRIIARHGGRTWAEGVPDAGATFYFTLPKAGSSSFRSTRAPFRT